MSVTSFAPGKPGVEVIEGYLPLDATLQDKRLLRQSIGKMIADKIAELDAFEMVPIPNQDGGWALRCRLVIHFNARRFRAQEDTNAT